MDILLTFEDGSSASLRHFGVKGMKWGVWNAETRARREGVKEIRKVAKSGKSFDAFKNTEIGKKVASDPDVVKALDRYVKSKSEEQRFNTSPELREKYTVKAADKAYDLAEKAGWTEGVTKDGRKWKSTREDFRNGYLYDDWDQGAGDSFTTYLEDRMKKGAINKEQYFKEQNDAYQSYKTAVDKAIDKNLGSSKTAVAKGKRTVENVLKDASYSHLSDTVLDNNAYGEYYPYKIYK